MSGLETTSVVTLGMMASEFELGKTLVVRKLLCTYRPTGDTLNEGQFRTKFNMDQQSYNMHTYPPPTRALHVSKSDMVALYAYYAAEVKKMDAGSKFVGAVMAACKCYNEERLSVVQRLLADPDAPPVNYQDDRVWSGTALLCAVRKGDVGVAKLLLTAGADADLAGEGTWGHWESPLNSACCVNDVDMARCLVDGGAQVNHSGGFAAPLINAAAAGHLETVVYLLDEAQADVNVGINERADAYTAINFAIEEKHLEVVDLLLKHGATTDEATDRAIADLRKCEASARNMGTVVEEAAEDESKDSGAGGGAAAADGCPVAVGGSVFAKFTSNSLSWKRADVVSDDGSEIVVQFQEYGDRVTLPREQVKDIEQLRREVAPVEQQFKDMLWMLRKEHLPRKPGSANFSFKDELAAMQEHFQWPDSVREDAKKILHLRNKVVHDFERLLLEGQRLDSSLFDLDGVNAKCKHVVDESKTVPSDS
jgi:hypothetical protein